MNARELPAQQQWGPGLRLAPSESELLNPPGTGVIQMQLLGDLVPAARRARVPETRVGKRYSAAVCELCHSQDSLAKTSPVERHGHFSHDVCLGHALSADGKHQVTKMFSQS